MDELDESRDALEAELSALGVRWLEARVRCDRPAVRRLDGLIDEKARELVRVERKLRKARGRSAQ